MITGVLREYSDKLMPSSSKYSLLTLQPSPRLVLGLRQCRDKGKKLLVFKVFILFSCDLLIRHSKTILYMYINVSVRQAALSTPTLLLQELQLGCGQLYCDLYVPVAVAEQVKRGYNKFYYVN